MGPKIGSGIRPMKFEGFRSTLEMLRLKAFIIAGSSAARLLEESSHNELLKLALSFRLMP
jgi:hypothetical protein